MTNCASVCARWLLGSTCNLSMHLFFVAPITSAFFTKPIITKWPISSAGPSADDPRLNKGWRQAVLSLVWSYRGLQWWDEVSQSRCSWPPNQTACISFFCLLLEVGLPRRWLNALEGPSDMVLNVISVPCCLNKLNRLRLNRLKAVDFRNKCRLIQRECTSQECKAFFLYYHLYVSRWI